MLLGGVALMQLSISGLRRKGRGDPAFKLTSSVVATGVSAATRNPMSLGFDQGCLGGAILAGSTYALLYTVLGVIPVHVFNVKSFEQLERRSDTGSRTSAIGNRNRSSSRASGSIACLSEGRTGVARDCLTSSLTDHPLTSGGLSILS